MTFEMVDMVWSTMGNDDFYSPSDLSSSLGRPAHEVARILECLAKYGFTECVTRREMIFRKIANPIAPGDALRTLQALQEGSGTDNVGRVTNLTKAPGRFDQR